MLRAVISIWAQLVPPSGVEKHAWMVLRKVSYIQETSFQFVFDPVINFSVHIPSNPPENLIFELVNQKHANKILGFPTGFFVMSITEFKGSTRGRISEGDAPLSSHI